MKKTATISDCRQFRYHLGRRWGDGQSIAFLMLNPSTADADKDDPTIRRCVAFAKSHGYSAIDVVNLYAFRATKPADLRRAGFPVGPYNNKWISDIARSAGAVCLAYGANAEKLERPQIVLPMLRSLGVEPMCLAITSKGMPQHPLMLSSECRLHGFTLEAIDEAMAAAKQRTKGHT